MRPLGLAIIALILAGLAALFMPIAAKHDPVAIFSQFLGASAIVLMAMTQFLATRAPGIELVFGGLDRIYVLHKWLAIAAILALIFHDTIDADVPGVAGGNGGVEEVAETLGEFALYALIGLIVVTLIPFVPYRLWYWTHKFMGLAFVFGALHFLLIARPFSLTEPVGATIAFFCLLGISSYLYLLLATRIGRLRHRYTVTKVDQTGGATAVTLAPVGGGLSHRAGQFVFVSFDGEHDETHPFTLSAAPDGTGSIRVTHRPIGDGTRSLRRTVEVGTKARVSRAHGHFRRRHRKGPEIWIAGGVGITPFVALAGGLRDHEGPVHLFASGATRSRIPHLDELEAVARENAALILHVVETAREARLTAEEIVKVSGIELSAAQVYFCGPAAMRETLQQGLIAAGLPPRRFHYEVFEIRSGIGLRRFCNWLLGILSSSASLSRLKSRFVGS